MYIEAKYLKPILDHLPNCFQYGINYDFTLIDSNKTVHDPVECQKQCFENTLCKYFSVTIDKNSPSDGCSLISRKTGQGVKMETTVFGPNVRKGEILLYLLILVEMLYYFNIYFKHK